MKMTMKVFYFCAWLFLGSVASCRQNNHENDTAEQIVRISATQDPETLDPRFGQGPGNTTILHMLYEGLVRMDFHGKPILAIAQELKISPDRKIYTFKIRKSYWSNGEIITANDFVETWKSLLDPHSTSMNASQLYLIKGAKMAKEGKIPLNEVGISSPDPKTLVVELESPAPYFLEMLATHFFFPVHKNFAPDNVIGNGPFKLTLWEQNSKIVMGKNEKYWDQRAVKLQQIIIMPMDEHKALRMFESGELEWAGAPLSVIPQDAIPSLKHMHQLHSIPAAETSWFQLNLNSPPLQNAKLRQALAYALNREAMVEHLIQGNQKAAMGIVPPSITYRNHSFFQDHDTPKAWYAFQEALEEMQISKDDFPALSLCYSPAGSNEDIAHAAKQQWDKVLGVQVNLSHCSAAEKDEVLSGGNYQIFLNSWLADYQDPMSFLQLFNLQNRSWSNFEYDSLLAKSELETDDEKRKESLKKAEELLLQEMPLIPLYFGSFNYVKADNLFGVYFSDLGYLDFKFAFYGQY